LSAPGKSGESEVPRLAAASLSFGREKRLLKKSDFSQCYGGGKRSFSARFVFFVLPAGGACWRLGLSVSRKVGGAVQRNRVKRLLREFFRINQAKLPPGVDIVAVAQKSLDPRRINYADLEQELLPLFNGLLKCRGQKRNARRLPGGAV
jgi:ribonuclease P protein component